MMGVLFDAIKRLFTKKRNMPVMDPQLSTPIEVDWEQYDQLEFKQSIGRDVELLKTVTIGNYIEHNARLQHRKYKSQQRNWSRWKSRRKLS